MTEKIEKIAKLVKAVTYDEMMEISNCFSFWTQISGDGEDLGSEAPGYIDRDTMAANLSGWADEVLSQAAADD